MSSTSTGTRRPSTTPPSTRRLSPPTRINWFVTATSFPIDSLRHRPRRNLAREDGFLLRRLHPPGFDRAHRKRLLDQLGPVRNKERGVHANSQQAYGGRRLPKDGRSSRLVEHQVGRR